MKRLSELTAWVTPANKNVIVRNKEHMHAGIEEAKPQFFGRKVSIGLILADISAFPLRF